MNVLVGRAIIDAMKITKGFYIFFSIMLLFTFSCSGKKEIKPPETIDYEKAFIEANKLLEKKDYEKARSTLLDIKSKDTSKKYASLAQLKIADSYIKEDEPDLAISEYNKFLDAYPDNQYAPYAQYQIAMVYFDKIEDAARGYSYAAKAIEEFEKLKKKFPRNPYKDIIDVRIKQSNNIIAEHEFLVGNFYYKKDSYNAALARFEGLLKKYPDYSGGAEVLFYIGMSYKNLGQKDKASEYLKRFIEKYPNNKFAKEANKELLKLKP
jgi:outer membrane protein assembly factor BamD